MGSVKTSPIVRVEVEQSAIVIRAIMEAAESTIARHNNPRIVTESIGDTNAPRRSDPTDFPYPEDNVIRLESAAHSLGAVCERRALADDLERFPDLMRRFEVALKECLLKVEVLGGRANRSD
jgi:hypothetical protein